MPKQSLFSACKHIIRLGTSGIEEVGGVDIGIEYYTQADIDANVEAIDRGTASGCTFGDNDESKVVLVAEDTLTIPVGYNLIPVYPKKSLVIMCNTLVNNGTISMTGKGPNVLPHDWYLLSKYDKYGADDNIIVSAYAYNSVTSTNAVCNGAAGTNRNCGSGSSGYLTTSRGTFYFKTGSGYAFGGGAGTGGVNDGAGSWNPSATLYVDETYPMRGSRGYGYRNNNDHNNFGYGGVGNPAGDNYDSWGKIVTPAQRTGVGGRLVIFCSEFINNGIISVNGISPNNNTASGWSPSSSGGASGAGAIDLFYYTLTTEGTLNAIGGSSVGGSGKGGDGSITLLNWDIEKVIREEEKVFTKENMVYLLTELTKRLKQDHIGE